MCFFSILLGNRERLMLVELEGHTVLIGVTQHTISNLHTFEGQLNTDVDAPAEFSNSLRAWMARK